MSDEKPDESSAKKLAYIKPEMQTDELMTFGALCNGVSDGTRKEDTGPPVPCAATHLKS